MADEVASLRERIDRKAKKLTANIYQTAENETNIIKEVQGSLELAAKESKLQLDKISNLKNSMNIVLINSIDRDFAANMPEIPHSQLIFDTDLKSAILPSGCAPEPAIVKQQRSSEGESSQTSDVKQPTLP